MGARDEQIPPAEWAAAAAGCAVLLGTIAFLVHGALAGPPTPPDLLVAADSVTHVSSGWLVHFRAENRGESAAAAVEVEGEAVRPAGAETSRAVLDYVPGGSTRRGGLFFTSDPRPLGDLRLRAVGYQAP